MNKGHAGHPVLNSPEKLKDIWDRIGAKWGEWILQEGRLEQLFAKSDLKALGIFGGIMTEKVLLLSGQPTQIFGQAEHQTLEQLEQKFRELAAVRAQRKALADQTQIEVTKGGS